MIKIVIGACVTRLKNGAVTIPHKADIFGLCLLGSCLIGGVALGQTSPAASDKTIYYNVPSQPLDTALNTLATKSGVQVLYETGLVRGRYSAPVRGVLSPAAALRVMLANSGLVGVRTDVDAFSVALPDAKASEIATPDAKFLGALQTEILASLCHSAATAPGDYRMAVQLWISPTGTVWRDELLSSTGERSRDLALAAALKDLRIQVSPADLPQPITLVIAPRVAVGDKCIAR